MTEQELTALAKYYAGATDSKRLPRARLAEIAIELLARAEQAEAERDALRVQLRTTRDIGATTTYGCTCHVSYGCPLHTWTGRTT